MNKFDVTITVKEVAWNNNEPTKYQATATVTQGYDLDGNLKVVKRIHSEPMHTEELAKKSLQKECDLWRECSVEASIYVKEYLEEEARIKAATEANVK